MDRSNERTVTSSRLWTRSGDNTAKFTWDYSYEVACNIIQTFDPHYSAPPVDVVIQSLESASKRAGSKKIDDIIKWAEDYATEWQKEHVK